MAIKAKIDKKLSEFISKGGDVSNDPNDSSMFKMHISINKKFLKEIDKNCEENGIKFRSTWITLAINEKLKRSRSE